jgi:hypothetical protein
MKKIWYLFPVLALIFASCSNGGGQSNASDTLKTTEVYEFPIINPGDFDSVAKNFVDKEIQVKGLVEHVCVHSGKKIFVADDKGSVRIESEERFNDSLLGNKIIVNGIVREFRVDETYCQQMENESHKNKKAGKADNETCESVKNQISEYRNSMKNAKTDHLSFYSLDFVSLKPEK